jgi:hypothetical protein
MNNVTTIGIDIAKNVFHAVWADQRGKQIKKMKLTRKTMATAFSNIPPCDIAMEACAGSHYWSRVLVAQGHQVKLIPPQYVKPFVKGNKNDYNDAQGIVEASVRPTMRFVSIKTPQQQDIQAIHRIRNELVKRRTAQSNQIRGLLGEYGVVMPKGLGVLRRRLPEILEDGENGLSDLFRELLSACYQEVNAYRRYLVLGRWYPVCSIATLGMDRAIIGAGMSRHRWDWYQNSIVLGIDPYYWVSQSGATVDCVTCWCMAPVRWSNMLISGRTP